MFMFMQIVSGAFLLVLCIYTHVQWDKERKQRRYLEIRVGEWAQRYYDVLGRYEDLKERYEPFGVTEQVRNEGLLGSKPVYSDDGRNIGTLMPQVREFHNEQTRQAVLKRQAEGS